MSGFGFKIPSSMATGNLIFLMKIMASYLMLIIQVHLIEDMLHFSASKLFFMFHVSTSHYLIN